jgi:hypothetical protein
MDCDASTPTYVECDRRESEKAAERAMQRQFERARESQDAEERAYQQAFRLRVGIALQVVAMGSAPALKLGADRGRQTTGPWFEIGDAYLPAAGGGAFVGPRLTIDVGPREGVYVPLAGIDVGWTPGSVYAEKARFGDVEYAGSGSSTFAAWEILGLGYRGKIGPVILGLSVRPGLALMKGGGKLTRDGLTISTDAVATSFLVRAELEVCTRIDDHHRISARVCGTVAPQYVFEKLDGAAIGLRFDIR